ncbi:hypothetical protein VpasPP24_117 [Vibrio phage Vpas_PP24]|nr:hypothetical protein VpasPP24_117 [Vibrio phage Vpas_PP24]
MRKTILSQLVTAAVLEIPHTPRPKPKTPERKPNYVLGDGEPCPMYSCRGIQEVSEVENCYCACTLPPCSNCLNTPLICSECNWNEYEHEPEDRP